MIGQQLFLDVQEFGRQARQVRALTACPVVGSSGRCAALGTARRARVVKGRASGCYIPSLTQLHPSSPHPPPEQAGVDAAALEPYRQLWATVAPEGQAGTIAF